MVDNQQYFIHVGSYEGSLLGFQGPLNNLESQYAFAASLGSIKSILVSGRFLFIGGFEESVKIYDIRKRKEVGLLEGHTGTITVIRSFQNFVFSGSEDKTIKVWKTKDWALVENLTAIKAPVIDLCIHKTGKMMISLTKDLKIQIWNLITMKRLFQRRYLLDGLQKVCFLDTQDESSSNIVLLGSKQVGFVDIETNKICHSVIFQQGLTDMLTCNDLVIVGDQMGFVFILKIDATSDKILMSFRAHMSRVKQMSLVQGNMTLLSTISTNGEIKIWDCLNYVSDEVEDTIEFENKLKPINMIKTNSRLTCAAFHVFETKEQQNEEIVEEEILKPVQKEQPKKQYQKSKLKEKKNGQKKMNTGVIRKSKPIKKKPVKQQA